MGIKYVTVGTGGDYADIGTMWAALYAFYPFVFPAPHMTDDWEVEIVSNFTENTGTGANYPFFDGHYVRITNPDGYTTQAVVVAGSVTALRFVSRSNSVNDSIVFDGLIFNIPFINPGAAYPFLSFKPGSQWSFVTARYKNLKFLCNGYQASAAARNSSLISVEDSFLQFCNTEISNCIFCNYGTAIGGWTSNAAQSVLVENSDIYQCYNGNNMPCVAGATFTLRNVVSADCANADYLNNSTNINFINCADSDGTLLTCGGNLTNCQHNIIPANEFESLTSTDDNFLRLYKGRLSANPVVDPDRGLKPLKCKFTSNALYNYGGNVLPTGGILPTIETNDLAEERYGKYGDYPIGCYNAEIAL